MLIINQKFSKNLKNINFLRNVRNSGLLFAFDFDTKELRDRFVKNLHENDMLCNLTGDFTVRLRPNLCVKKK